MSDNRNEQQIRNEQQGAAGASETKAGQGAEVAQATGRAAQRGGQAGKAGAQAAAGAAHDGGQAMQRSTEDAAEQLRAGAEAFGRTAAMGMESMGHGAGRLSETAADQFTRMGEMFATAGRDAAENARRMMSLPSVNTNGFRELQHATGTLLDRVVETHVRITQELVNRANPAEVATLQQRLIREYLNAFTESSAEILNAARRFADEALRPIQEQQRQLQQQSRQQGQSRGGQQGGARQGGQPQAKVAEVMSSDVKLVRPDDTVQQAARLMAGDEAGALPVAEGDRLIGMVTDRDISTRLAAEGKDPARTRVREVMTDEIRYCYDDEDLEHVAENMAELQVRRLPVMNRQKRLVGIVSAMDIARRQPQLGQILAGAA